MAKSELKTKQTEASVENFLSEIADENVREDCEKISAMMGKITGEKPKMSGASIVGFGQQHLKYESGRELDWMEIGFAPRKTNLTLYGLDFDDNLLAKLGKYKLGKGCLYFKKLSDIDEEVLGKLIEKSVEKIRRK